MEKPTWRALNNPFEIATRNSIRKMNSIAGDHFLRLQNGMANPIILAIYNLFQPIWLDFEQAYLSYKMAISDAQGTTLELQNLWELASSEKYDEWDTAIKTVYKRDSPEHKSLLPNGHEPFRTGMYAERIANIKTLHGNLLTDPALAAAATMVGNFITEYDAVFATHVGKQSHIKQSASDLKDKRITVAVAMFSNLGALVQHFPTQPLYVESYFDISQIVRSTPKPEGDTSNELTIAIPAGSSKEGGFPFTDETNFLFYDSGITQLAINTSPTPMQPMPPLDALKMQPEDEAEKVANVLGAPGNRYLIITNLDPLNDGEITISIVE